MQVPAEQKLRAQGHTILFITAANVTGGAFALSAPYQLALLTVCPLSQMSASNSGNRGILDYSKPGLLLQ